MTNVIFTKEECEYIKSFWSDENSISGNEPIEIQRKDGSSFTLRYNKSNKASYCVIEDSKVLDFILQKVKHLDIIKIPSLKIMKYEEGDVLPPHKDFGSYGAVTNYKTLAIQLTDETEYEGGDLCIWGEPQERTLGSYSIFLRTEEHEVTKVTKGTRYSGVLFLGEDCFNITKSII